MRVSENITYAEGCATQVVLTFAMGGLALMFALVANQVAMVIFHLQWIDLGLEAAVAYLLLQRENSEWFRQWR